MINIDKISFNCYYFKGEMPCQPSKQNNFDCSACSEFKPISKKILIIKLGAIGDVIRTTPLVVKYKNLYPNCHITWLTNYPEILPADKIEKILPFDFISTYNIAHQIFDIAINLDKDFEACSLLTDLKASEKYGFIIKNGHISTADKNAEHKLITGLFDNYSKENTKSYLSEIFEICGLAFDNEPYLLPLQDELNNKWSVIKKDSQPKKIIGLNTGCGARWQTRLWPEDYWIQLIHLLQQNGYYPIVLGGKDEHTKNTAFADKTGAYYPGHHSLQEFIAILNQCDAIVTAVSMTMHIAMGLNKPLILFNNIFNKHEFYLYNNGVILEPETGCDCYYGNKCKRERNCMNDISVTTVINSIINIV